MQVVTPIDIEDTLSIDLGAILPKHRCFAPPKRDDLRAGDVMVTRLGGAPATASTSDHDVSIDVWAKTPAEAVRLANVVCGVVNSLPLRATTVEYKTARAIAPYSNPDPDRPTLPRATFTATVGTRGEDIEF